jgi:uncharacterized protein
VFQVEYVCQRCGACCRWEGQVKVTRREIAAIAAFLGIPEAEFIQNRTRLRYDRRGLALLEKPNGECEFLEGNRCRIQSVKPKQCRDFPNLWRDGADGVCKAIPVPTAEPKPTGA